MEKPMTQLADANRDAAAPAGVAARSRSAGAPARADHEENPMSEPSSDPVRASWGTTVFPPTVLPGLRRRLQRLLRVPDPGDESPFDGRLVVSSVNPSDAVRALKHLRLRPGLVLRGVQLIAGGNGNGFVFAVPESSQPGDPRLDVRSGKEVIPGVVLPYPKPPDALPHFMDAIEGDGTPRAFLEASILMRELEEFGATWHGCSWSFHEVVCADPLAPGARLFGEMKEVCGHRRDEWRWRAAPPPDWRPRVTVGAAGTTVEFHSVKVMEACMILRHTDTYRPGSMNPESAYELLADGPIGGIP